jgi:preprotein translocase subunit SecD
MQRKLLFKALLVLALAIAAFYALYPTFQLSGLQNQEKQLVTQIKDLTGLSSNDIDAALANGDLENQIRMANKVTDKDKALTLADQLIRLNTQIATVEGKAIRRGLDLQGGTFMVYEVDLRKFLDEVAKNKDARLDDILKATQKDYESGNDFFKSLQSNFESRNIKLNRYFGRRGQPDEEILKELATQSEDAVNRTLEVLRNRVDQFGVSEPSIQKQGTQRIIIELPGIQNIQRAKKVIGTTALLEFKLVKEADVIWSIFNDIDKVLRTKRQGLAQEIKATDAQKDTAKVADGKQAQDKQVNINELFGDKKNEAEATPADTSVVVDKATFDEKPFTSLLRGMGGRYSEAIAVPVQNVAAVQRILQMPEVVASIPNDVQFLFSNRNFNTAEMTFQQLYLVKKEPELVGSMLTSAEVNIGGGMNDLSAGGAEVSMVLNSEGAKIFAKTTGMNVGKQLAIVLDSRVASAPNIKEKIPNGSARIDGIGSMDEAKDLALVLRAGALPAPVHVLTENTVGPSLGQDSVNAGTKSALIGLLLVMIFVVVYYNAVGLIANFALILNGLFVLAIMAGFHFTLTLPGIAGFILSVAMAIDSNVLINERIREELRNGKTIRAAIETGYDRAFVTILDSNVTTLITGVVLYMFGTGSVRGFAVTLCIGILVSMFTAIFVTRLVLDFATTRFAIKKLSI